MLSARRPPPQRRPTPQVPRRQRNRVPAPRQKAFVLRRPLPAARQHLSPRSMPRGRPRARAHIQGVVHRAPALYALREAQNFGTAPAGRPPSWRGPGEQVRSGEQPPDPLVGRDPPLRARAGAPHTSWRCRGPSARNSSPRCRHGASAGLDPRLPPHRASRSGRSPAPRRPGPAAGPPSTSHARPRPDRPRAAPNPADAHPWLPARPPRRPSRTRHRGGPVPPRNPQLAPGPQPRSGPIQLHPLRVTAARVPPYQPHPLAPSGGFKTAGVGARGPSLSGR